MSLAIDRLNPVVINDPRVCSFPAIYPVLRGAADILYKSYTTTSISSSSIQFSAPPTAQTWIDRRVHLQTPVRVTVVATGLNPGVLLFNYAQVAIRSYPVMKSLESMIMTLNNQAVSVNISDVMSAVEHFNIDRRLKASEYSATSTYGCCQSQQFGDLYGAARSPMALYQDGIDDLAPQAFPFTIVSQVNNAAGMGISTCTSVLDFVDSTPIFLSPLFWGSFCHDESGFFNLTTFDLNLNFINNANRMIAIDNIGHNGSGVAFTPTTITSTMQFSNFSPAFSYNQSQPLLTFQYLQPQLVDKSANMSKVFNYPFFDVQRYPTDFSSMAPGQVQQISSNNVQLSSIPSKLYIFARANNNMLYANPFTPDTFLALENISIQFANRNSVLASCSKRELYRLSVKNGCNMTWTAWSGEKNNSLVMGAGFGTAANQYSGTGSVLALDMLDIGSFNSSFNNALSAA